MVRVNATSHHLEDDGSEAPLAAWKSWSATAAARGLGKEPVRGSGVDDAEPSLPHPGGEVP